MRLLIWWSRSSQGCIALLPLGKLCSVLRIRILSASSSSSQISWALLFAKLLLVLLGLLSVVCCCCLSGSSSIAGYSSSSQLNLTVSPSNNYCAHISNGLQTNNKLRTCKLVERGCLNSAEFQCGGQFNGKNCGISGAEGRPTEPRDGSMRKS